MGTFAKIYDKILGSSLSDQIDPELGIPVYRDVFVMFCVRADKNGLVEGTEESLIRTFNYLGNREAWRRAMEILESPDPQSRSKELGGQRIVRLPGNGFRVVNYSAYASRGPNLRAEVPARNGAQRRADPARNSARTRPYIDSDLDVDLDKKAAEARTERAAREGGRVYSTGDQEYISEVWRAFKARKGKPRMGAFKAQQKEEVLGWRAHGIPASFAADVILTDSRPRKSIRDYTDGVIGQWRERKVPEQLEIPQSTDHPGEEAVEADAIPPPAPVPTASEGDPPPETTEIARVVLGRQLRPDEAEIAGAWSASLGPDLVACGLLYQGARDAIKGTEIRHLRYFGSGVHEGPPRDQIQIMAAMLDEMQPYLRERVEALGLPLERQNVICDLLSREQSPGDRLACLLAGITAGCDWVERRRQREAA